MPELCTAQLRIRRRGGGRAYCAVFPPPVTRGDAHAEGDGAERAPGRGRGGAHWMCAICAQGRAHPNTHTHTACPNRGGARCTRVRRDEWGRLAVVETLAWWRGLSQRARRAHTTRTRHRRRKERRRAAAGGGETGRRVRPAPHHARDGGGVEQNQKKRQRRALHTGEASGCRAAAPGRAVLCHATGAKPQTAPAQQGGRAKGRQQKNKREQNKLRSCGDGGGVWGGEVVGNPATLWVRGGSWCEVAARVKGGGLRAEELRACRCVLARKRG